MLMHTREGTIIVTQQEKLKTKPDNGWKFISKALLCSIPSAVEKASLVICNGQFFIFAPDKPSWAKPTFTLYIF